MIPNENEKDPRFSYRGVMLDCCRHFFPIDDIKKLIAQMSILKLNYFHWHLSNDQGFRLESKRFPKLNEVSSWRRLDDGDPWAESGEKKAGERYGGYYTQSEIKEIVAFAKERGVEVVPEIELPGHTTAILASFPELSCAGTPLEVASTFGIHDRILCAGEENVYQFLFELLDEITPLFPCNYFHIGGDEAPKTEWKKCPKCGAVMQKYGYKNYECLQQHFVNRVIGYLRQKGKTTIVWNESAIEDELDESAVIQYWMEMGGGESYLPKEFNKGRKFIFSNQCQFYCDYSYAETPLRATLQFEPNVKGIPVPAENVLGIEAPMWTEWTGAFLDCEKMLYPRLLAVAECGWARKRNTEEFLSRAKEFLKEPTRNVLVPMPWEDATVTGDKALKEIAENMLKLSEKHGKMAAKSGKRAEAVVPENAPKVDPQMAVYEYMKAKMESAYTEEEIKKVLRLLSKMRNKNEKADI